METVPLHAHSCSMRMKGFDLQWHLSLLEPRTGKSAHFTKSVSPVHSAFLLLRSIFTLSRSLLLISRLLASPRPFYRQIITRLPTEAISQVSLNRMSVGRRRRVNRPPAEEKTTSRVKKCKQQHQILTLTPWFLPNLLTWTKTETWTER